MFWEVSHIADKAIRVESNSLENLFYESALALNYLFGNELSSNKTIFIEKYEDNAIDYEILLVNFLNFLFIKELKDFTS